MQPFTKIIVELILSIPRGRVTSYGTLAAMAGNRRAARQVVRILHTYSKKLDLPWHRVVNKKGLISLVNEQGYAEQRSLLESEGVTFKNDESIDLDKHMWPSPDNG